MQNFPVFPCWPQEQVQPVSDVGVAAGALVTQNVEIPDNSLVVGNPGKVKRAVTEEEIRWNLKNAHIYVEEAQKELSDSYRQNINEI